MQVKTNQRFLNQKKEEKKSVTERKRRVPVRFGIDEYKQVRSVSQAA